jgi:hypothetical protein
MTAKAYIYAEDGALLGYLAYDDVPPDVLELGERYFQKHGTSREMDERNPEILCFDYWEIDVGTALDVIYVCMTCGRNASLVWWKCCPDHVTFDGPDLICQSCVEKLHPGDPEFERE